LPGLLEPAVLGAGAEKKNYFFFERPSVERVSVLGAPGA